VAGVQCTPLAFRDELHKMLKIMQRFGKYCSCHIFTLKMATAVFVETLDNFQHLTQLIPEAKVVNSEISLKI
jgi:hypothetical protein